MITCWFCGNESTRTITFILKATEIKIVKEHYKLWKMKLLKLGVKIAADWVGMWATLAERGLWDVKSWYLTKDKDTDKVGRKCRILQRWKGMRLKTNPMRQVVCSPDVVIWSHTSGLQIGQSTNSLISNSPQCTWVKLVKEAMNWSSVADGTGSGMYADFVPFDFD